MPPQRQNNSIAEMDYAGKRHSGIYRTFDIVVKFVTAGAFIYAAYVAGQFESKVSGTTILVQREQSESQLRASMFQYLIDPIVGPVKEGERIPIDRERLLVELLTLNFHEHLEFKPLLEDIHKRLATNKSLSKENAGIQQSRLRSVARRVINRQITVLSVEAEKGGLQGYEPEQIFFKDSIEANSKWYWSSSEKETDISLLNGPTNPANLNDKVCVKSPDNEYLLEIILTEIDIQNYTCTISVTIKDLPAHTIVIAPTFFTLTQFDFPFTDNTRIDNDHRFSIVIDNFENNSPSEEKTPEEKTIVGLKLIWFHKDFISSRERPLNYSEIRKLLNVD